MLEESTAKITPMATKCRVLLVIDYFAHSTLALSGSQLDAIVHVPDVLRKLRYASKQTVQAIQNPYAAGIFMTTFPSPAAILTTDRRVARLLALTCRLPTLSRVDDLYRTSIPVA